MKVYMVWAAGIGCEDVELFSTAATALKRVKEYKDMTGGKFLTSCETTKDGDTFTYWTNEWDTITMRETTIK